MESRKIIFWKALVIFTVIFTFSTVSAASAANIGVNLGEWGTAQVKGIVFFVLACAAGFFLVKNQILGLVKYIILAVICLFLIYLPDTFQAEGNNLVKTIFGW